MPRQAGSCLSSQTLGCRRRLVSAELEVFVPNADDSLIPAWTTRLNGLGMRCEIHPKFSFRTHRGFLPFKVEIERPKHPSLVGKAFLTGFEFDMHEFSLAKELEELMPEPTVLDRLKGKKAATPTFVSREVDSRLANCRAVIRCTWGTADSLELRMATISAAILAELTGGISSYTADDYWYTESGGVEKALSEAEAYEGSIPVGHWKLHEFEKWL